MFVSSVVSLDCSVAISLDVVVVVTPFTFFKVAVVNVVPLSRTQLVFNVGEVNVLFVSVSVVFLPTKLSSAVVKSVKL